MPGHGKISYQSDSHPKEMNRSDLRSNAKLLHLTVIDFVKPLDSLQQEFVISLSVDRCDAHVRVRKQILDYKRVRISPD